MTSGHFSKRDLTSTLFKGKKAVGTGLVRSISFFFVLFCFWYPCAPVHQKHKDGMNSEKNYNTVMHVIESLNKNATVELQLSFSLTICYEWRYYSRLHHALHDICKSTNNIMLVIRRPPDSNTLQNWWFLTLTQYEFHQKNR